MIDLDPRKAGLKKGLRQLTNEQIVRVVEYPHEMILDRCNYEDGKFCPLAVAVGLDSMIDPSDEKVVAELESRGYSVYNTRGIVGMFYTSNRREDLILAANEILAERGEP